ncbi:MAG: hypothetical protein R6W69_10050 [Anaerolineales bacterium]
MKAKTLISTTVFIACIFASCAPVIKAKPTETPTPASQAVLIAYTLSVDGGDELVNCLAGSNQPQFILFADGQLIIYKNGQYWESALLQNETVLLMNKIENTGILRLGEIETDGFAELIVKGKVYHFSHVNYPAKPIEQVVKIINQYQPDSPKHYVPENLLLWIYPVESVAQFEEYLPKPIPPTKDWSKDLKSLSEFGEGFRNISGDMLPGIMAQFDGFPDYQIFKAGDSLYLSAICANFP